MACPRVSRVYGTSVLVVAIERMLQELMDGEPPTVEELIKRQLDSIPKNEKDDDATH